MPVEGDPKPKSKHRKSTCAGCRRRKSKCDGKTPKCTTCIAYKDECHYDKPPSLAYVRSLEEEVHDLKVQLRQSKTQAWLSRAGSQEGRKVPSPASETEGSQGSNRNLAHRNRQIKWESDISMDDNGGVTFHNSTSTMYEAPKTHWYHSIGRVNNLNTPNAISQDEQRSRKELVLNATRQRQIEPFAIANGAAQLNIPQETSLELLNYHWCWQHPIYLFIYRPAFIRGMSMLNSNVSAAEESPYFSETLLKVVHAHCSRFLNHETYQNIYQAEGGRNRLVTTSISSTDFRDQMATQARLGLGMDILKESSIPTIQSLLQQSGREVMFGNSSQAWTFAGIAFRMALDLGIHLPSDKIQAYVKGLTVEDIEIRKRLFWSCYTWDKALSLYLGRMPGFTPSVDDVPLTFLDDLGDSDPWVPYYGEGPQSEPQATADYPPSPGYVVSCFQQMCTLSVILNDLLHSIYSGDATARRESEEDDTAFEVRAVNQAPFTCISNQLQNWFASLPSHLRLDPDNMPQLAPPAHIVSLNLLYHSTVILLHRPVILGARDLNHPGPAKSYLICIRATAAIHDLILLQANTFGLSHVSYLNAYAVYIGATIAVLQLEREAFSGENPAVVAQKNGLNYLLDVLQETSNMMPALERSNSIIRKRFQAVLDQTRTRTYSNASTPPRYVFPTPTSQQMELAQSTVFQTLSNPVLAHMSYAQADRTGSFSTPSSVQSGVRSSLYFEPGQQMHEFLPAFPGQQFPIGSEHVFGGVELDPPARAALLGYNLDPHPRLNSGDIDWSFTDHYEGLAMSL